MKKKNKKLRKPDGKPEHRRIDDLLAQAASEKEVRDLPGFGKPIDLDTYFKGGQENRVANQLLKDNNILPQHIQDGKDADGFREAAEALLQEKKSSLLHTRKEVESAAKDFCTLFSTLDSLLKTLGWAEWPFLCHQPGDTLNLQDTNLAESLEISIRFKDLVQQYN